MSLGAINAVMHSVEPKAHLGDAPFYAAEADALLALLVANLTKL